MPGVLDGAVTEMEGRYFEFSEEVKTETSKQSSMWSGLADGIQTKMATTWSEMLKGATSIGDGIKGVLGSIRDNFFDMAGQMLAKWTTGVLSGMVLKTAEASTAMVSSLGNIGAAVGGIGKGLGGLITSLANGIAAASKTIAASAPAILKAAAVALAIYASFKIVGGLIDSVFGGGGGKMDATNRELHNIWINTQNLENWVGSEIKPNIEVLKESAWKKEGFLDSIMKSSWTRDSILGGILTAVNAQLAIFKKVKFSASGFSGEVTSPTLFMAGESGPERVEILPKSQGGGDVHVHLHVNAIDAQSVNTFLSGSGGRKIKSMVQDAIRGKQIMVPLGSVGG